MSKAKVDGLTAYLQSNGLKVNTEEFAAFLGVGKTTFYNWFNNDKYQRLVSLAVQQARLTEPDMFELSEEYDGAILLRDQSAELVLSFEECFNHLKESFDLWFDVNGVPDEKASSDDLIGSYRPISYIQLMRSIWKFRTFPDLKDAKKAKVDAYKLMFNTTMQVVSGNYDQEALDETKRASLSWYDERVTDILKTRKAVFGGFDYDNLPYRIRLICRQARNLGYDVEDAACLVYIRLKQARDKCRDSETFSDFMLKDACAGYMADRVMLAQVEKKRSTI